MQVKRPKIPRVRPSPADVVALASPQLPDVSVRVEPTGKNYSMEVQAKKIADLIADGSTVEAASQEILGRPATAITRNPDFRDAVLASIVEFSLPPEIMKRLVRSERLKMLMDPETDDKMKAEMMKQIAADPDVGLTAPPQNTVTVNIGAVAELIKNAEPADVIDAEIVRED